MPRLEHANIAVSDVQPTLDFLQCAFPDWRVRGSGSSPWYGVPRNWLHFGDDETYVVLNDHAEGDWRDLKGATPGLMHLGFVVDDLDVIMQRLTEAGYKVHADGADHPHRRNIYYLDGAGLEFEFTEYLSDVPAEKNLYT